MRELSCVVHSRSLAARFECERVAAKLCHALQTALHGTIRPMENQDSAALRQMAKRLPKLPVRRPVHDQPSVRKGLVAIHADFYSAER